MSKKPDLPMFTFQVFCEGDKLALCIKALSGLVLNNINPRPVENAVFDGREIRAIHNGTLLSAFKQHLKSSEIKVVKPSEIKMFCIRHGKPESSYSSLLRESRAEGFLKKAKKSGGSTKTAYDVVQGSLNG